MMSNLKPAVFLDRDGTINIDKNYLYQIEEFEYMDGVVDAMKELCDLGYLLIIITNQSGIARGYYTEEEFKTLNEWMLQDLKEKGIIITKVYYCPHCKEGKIPQYSMDCLCRKPKTKLFWDAQREYGIDMRRSFAIGDKLRDLSICEESDVSGILLSDSSDTKLKGIIRCDDFGQAISYIKNHTRCLGARNK